MKLKPGLRLRSQVCTTEVIIVRGSGDTDLACGGKPLAPSAEAAGAGASPAPGLDTGTEIGKRYVVEGDSSIEVLCTKGGPGTLSVGDTPLVLKEAKPLPASD